MFKREVKEISDRDSVARAEKQTIAKNASLPILKLLGTNLSNEELRERLDSAWQNSGVLSAFVAAIAVSFLFVEIPLDETDEEYDTKRTVKSAFFIIAATASVLLVLSVSLIVTNLTSLLVCPLDYVDDFLHHLGPLEGIPSVLMVVSIVALVAMIPMWVFLSFGSGTEFFVTLLVAAVATVSGLFWQISMMHLQNQLLDNWMAANVVVSKSGKPVKEKGAPENPVVELSNVY